VCGGASLSFLCELHKIRKMKIFQALNNGGGNKKTEQIALHTFTINPEIYFPTHMCAGFLYSRSRSQLNSHIKMFLVRFFYITANEILLTRGCWVKRSFFRGARSRTFLRGFWYGAHTCKKCQFLLMAPLSSSLFT
jgi:hypothetical protein